MSETTVGRSLRVARPHAATLATFLLAGGAVACHHASIVEPAVVARATMRTAAGADAGAVEFLAGADGATVLRFHLRGLTPGDHGVHLHAVGACDGTTATPFASAGAHLNPASAKHGLASSEGPHAGDLPNVAVAADGTADVTVTTSRVHLDAASAAPLFDPDGTAIVVHAAADDQRTDPSGNSGARVACGVVGRVAG